MLDIAVLNEVCALIHNWFDNGDSFSGEFDIQNGDIVDLPEWLKAGAYVRIEDSSMNDGAYCVGGGGLADESFEGRLTVMKLPADFRNLVSEIADWKKANVEVLTGVYQSENYFGDYSYTISASEEKTTVTGVFGKRLNKYRKV